MHYDKVTTNKQYNKSKFQKMLEHSLDMVLVEIIYSTNEKSPWRVYTLQPIV